MQAVLALFLSPNDLSSFLEQTRALRSGNKNGYPVLIIASRLGNLCALGSWLHEKAVAKQLEGIRLLAANNAGEAAAALPEKLTPVCEPSVIIMPVTPEVETSRLSYLYTISPELRSAAELMRQFAENNIGRIYLLGPPGAGKTSLAYYYWLSRKQGRFVTVNLTAESTGDKAAMKSLLCGHVAGAYGPSSR